jgi:signal peptidase I
MDRMNRAIRSCFLVLASQVTFLLILTMTRCFVEARYLPSTSMIPNLGPGDRIILEKVSRLTGKLVERGAIVVFYPPPIMMGGRDLSNDPSHLLGRLTGLPCFANDPAFVKRIIGVAGDRIEIKAGIGVYVNGKLLDEPYITAPAQYGLDSLYQISGRSTLGEVIQPYGGTDKPIVVPKGSVFVLGDSRDISEDSHTFGFVPEDRIFGRAWLLAYPRSQYMRMPGWRRQ